MVYILRLGVFFLRIIYAPFKLLRVKERIVLISRQANDTTLDFKLLKEALNKNFPDTEVIILARKLEGGLLSKAGYAFHILKQMKYIASSRVIVVDGYCIPVSVLKHTQEHHIIQIWHAVNIIKQFGCQTIDKPEGTSSAVARAMHMHENYDEVWVSGRGTIPIASKTFNMPAEKIRVEGLPRIDYIRSERAEVTKAIKEKYPQVTEKPNILYAPTFRRNSPVDLKSVCEAVDAEKYNLIVKLHPVDKYTQEDFISQGVIIDREFLSYDWLHLCDSVITDYSGIAVESALLNKKIYFFVYDYEYYTSNNGLNLDLYSEPISHYVASNAMELRALLAEEYDMQAAADYRDKYVQNYDICHSDSMAARLISLLKQK